MIRKIKRPVLKLVHWITPPQGYQSRLRRSASYRARHVHGYLYRLDGAWMSFGYRRRMAMARKETR